MSAIQRHVLAAVRGTGPGGALGMRHGMASGEFFCAWQGRALQRQACSMVPVSRLPAAVPARVHHIRDFLERKGAAETQAARRDREERQG